MAKSDGEWNHKTHEGFHETCPVTRKIKYASLREAKRDMRRLKGSGGKYHQYAYRCTFCDGWHLTSSPRARKWT